MYPKNNKGRLRLGDLSSENFNVYDDSENVDPLENGAKN
ncbi:Uncharacterized protein FWK35_00000624 [Aphis craccivora]|uniref:Uncharacterized protein n=1 Tax=Aphis craccivora TaxID=307492 RepID=A0A6G0Z6G8_APHCR|nr:Uncharacterized protein FWK35_00000624 [Aphis craccivora]